MARVSTSKVDRAWWFGTSNETQGMRHNFRPVDKQLRNLCSKVAATLNLVSDISLHNVERIGIRTLERWSAVVGEHIWGQWPIFGE